MLKAEFPKRQSQRLPPRLEKLPESAWVFHLSGLHCKNDTTSLPMCKGISVNGLLSYNAGWKSTQTEDVMKQSHEEIGPTYNLDSLSQANLEKIHGTVMDIEDKLQVNPDPTVEIDWRLRNQPKALEGLDDLECRIDALTFLQNWGVIQNHNCNKLTPMIGEPIWVSVNIPEYY